LKTVLIKGPVLLEIKGECNILGVKFRNECISWESSRIIPIEKNNNSTLSIIDGRRWNHHRYDTISHHKRIGISIWKDLVRNILKQEKKRIIIIGPTNSGKSTLSLYLANVFLNHGLKPLLIDADIGQGDLAPPTCMGAAVMSSQEIDLWKVKTHRTNFIGGIQPIGYESKVISTIRQQLNLSVEHDLSIINTDGYIKGNGRIYKIDLLKKIQPDCIIYLGGASLDRNVWEIFSHIPRSLKMNFIYGEKQAAVHNRSILERYTKRMKTFTKFLPKDNELTVKIDLCRIDFIYFRNKFYSEIKCLKEYMSSNVLNEKILYIPNNEFLKNRFVGFGNKIDRGQISGFGLVADFEDGVLRVKANVKEFDTIFLSDTKLDLI
jgi:polynucleotide 5'-hydroxyl-kinase GRC3/NOL9